MTFDGSVWVCVRAASSKGTNSLVSGMVPSRFGDESFSAGGNCRKPTVWTDSLVVRVLTHSARGPGFKPCAFSSPVTLIYGKSL